MHAYWVHIEKKASDDTFMVKQSSQAKTPGSSSNASKAADPAAEPAAGTAVSRPYSPLAADASKPAPENSADAAAEPAAGSAVSGGYSSAVGDVPQDAASKASATDDGAAGGAQPMDTTTGTSDKKADDDDDDADESTGLSECSCFWHLHASTTWTTYLPVHCSLVCCMVPSVLLTRSRIAGNHSSI